MRVRERRNIGSCSEYLEGTLDAIVTRLKEQIEDCENPRFETEWVQDSESYLILVWDRPETDKERARRLRKAKTAKATKKKQAANRRSQELKTLERLQKKYGPKSP